MTTFTFSIDGNIRNLKLNKKNIDFAVNDPRGDVGVELNKKGRRVLSGAQRRVGVETGGLKAALKMEHRRDGVGQYVWVGARHRLAQIHHEGTRPHKITPRTHKALRFSVGSRIVYAREVNHPGTRPNRYLSDSLYLARL